MTDQDLKDRVIPKHIFTCLGGEAALTAAGIRTYCNAFMAHLSWANGTTLEITCTNPRQELQALHYEIEGTLRHEDGGFKDCVAYTGVPDSELLRLAQLHGFIGK